MLLSNLPTGFVHGKDYAAIVTDDLFQMGKSVAEMIGDALGGKGRVALLYHDANYYVTNQRDLAVKAVLQRDYPGIEIVAERGIADPNDGNVVASALLTQYPNLDAIYAPWDTIAEGVVAAARSVSSKVQIFTIDLGNTSAMDMARGRQHEGDCGRPALCTGSKATEVGALSVLGRETPPFVTVPAVKIDRGNLAEMWPEVMNEPLPQDIANVLSR